MTAVFRTPEDRFEKVPGFAFEPNYRTVGDLRLAHIDVGEGPPVVMLHGSPTWSFIWRKVIPPVRDAGYRCVVPDHAGFGRSDKPTDPTWHSLQRHVEITGSLLEDLDLRDVSLVVHDWGGPIGLSLALTHPDRIARIVILDTAIDPREAWMNDAWVRVIEFIERTESLPVGELVRAICLHDPGDDVVAAYEAPFPMAESQGARGLYMSVPRMDDDRWQRRTAPRKVASPARVMPARVAPAMIKAALWAMTIRRGQTWIAAGAAEAAYDLLRRDTRPMLILWAESDLFLTLASGERLASGIGRQIDNVISDAGHALQEDQGPMIGDLIAEWLLSGAR